MGITKWLVQGYLQRRVRKQSQKLNEIRASLRRVQSRSPQLRPMVRPELERIRQLSKQLKKVRSREDLRHWRVLYEMCLPAFEAALNLAQPVTGKGKRRTKRRGKK